MVLSMATFLRHRPKLWPYLKKIKHAYLSELLTGDTSNDSISPGGSDGGEINS